VTGTTGPYYRSVIVLGVLSVAVLLLSRCVNTEQKATGPEPAPGWEAYAAPATCGSCHTDIYQHFLQTAHYKTGLPANDSTVMGSFEKGTNEYSYTDQIKLVMEHRDSGLYQVAFFRGAEKKAMRFDMVIGSGVMGQSYLNWRADRLYQLPITFFTAANQWSNSPGFPSERVLIDRPVTARCLECHVTYAGNADTSRMEPLHFDKNRILYSVDCQKCHGPAAAHVQYHTANPKDTVAKHIINPTNLSRNQQLDICALCHGGNIQKTQPSFSFTAGKKLADYFTVDTTTRFEQNSPVDVHGNQVGLLRSSKCFQQSATLTCNTCHNTHENERGQAALFSTRCQTCHAVNQPAFQTATHRSVKNITANCIDCHMPAQPSKSIAVDLQGKETPRASLLRTHFIGIYPGDATNYLNKLKQDEK